jgi:LacI family transcriptional regulator
MTNQYPKISRVTGSQVAALAKVDAAVVSKILKEDPDLRVSVETRKRVMDAIEQLGYRPNYAAQRLRSSRKIGAVGLIIPNFSNPAFGEIVHGAEIAALKQKVALFVSSNSELTTPLELIIDLVASGRVDGLLIAGGSSSETAEINDYLSSRHFPFLFLNRQSVGIRRSLFLDDEYAIGLLVDHLVELGHKKIYNIAGLSSMETGKRRQAAFKKAITEAGLTFSPDSIVEEEYSYIGGQRGFQEIFNRRPKVTAVVVSEFNMAVGALNAARMAQVTVPDEMSMVAFNNLEFASLLNPALTTVGLQLQHLGEEGLNLLLEKQPNEEIYQTVSKSAELFLRESSKSLRK